jgi:hypothetical protein
LTGDKTTLLGECGWQASPLTGRDLTEPYRKTASDLFG